MFVDTGRSANVLFQHYEASPEAIETSAQELDGHATRIQAFSTETNAQHRAALANVSGVISQPLSTAAVDPTQRSSRLLGMTYVSSGSIRLFGKGVGQFNHTIDNLNEQYRQAQAADFGVAEVTHPADASFVEVAAAEEARAGRVMGARVDLLRTLVQKYREARARLDQEAEVSAAKINEGPTEQVLQDLYAAGALPSTVETAFPNIAFTANTLPADFEQMSDAELAEYLQTHPKLLSNDQAMAEIAQRIEGLTMEDGEASGRTLRDALSDRASMSDVYDELALLSLVGMYGSYAQSRGKAMPDGATQYVRGLFTDLVHGSPTGEDRTMDVLDWITAPEHQIEVKMPPEGGAPGGPLETQTRMVPGFDQATQDWMKQAYADGILLMSNDATNGPGLGDYISPDVEAALNDVIRIEEGPVSEEAGNHRTNLSLVGGDGFAKLADLLGHSSEGYGSNGIEPGRLLAEELTESSAETAQVINTASQNVPSDSGINYLGEAEALDRFGPLLEQAVDVAARNVDVNEALLTEAGSNGDSPAAEQLRELYTFPWPDDGKSVSQYTDWIADYSVPDDRSAAELAKVDQAERASAGFIKFVTDADDDGSTNNFKALMQFTNERETRSFGDVNPELAKGFGLVTASNLDALDGRESAAETTADSFNGRLSVRDADRHRLFTLVATSESAARDLGYTIGAYEQDRLDDALATGVPKTLNTRATEAARLDGYLAGGLLNARMIETDGVYKDRAEAADEAMKYVTVGKAVVTGGLSYVDGAGAVSAATGVLFDQLGSTIEVPEVPPGTNVSGPSSDGYIRSLALWDYAMALDRSDSDKVVMLEGLEDTLDQIRDHLRKKHGADVQLTGAHLGTPELDAIEAVLKEDPLYKEYMNDHPGAASFRDTAINDEGTHNTNGVDDFLEGRKG